MPDRRDRDNELDMVRKIATLEADVTELKASNKIMEDRWNRHLSTFIKALIAGIIFLGTGTATGASEAVRKKIITFLSWFTP